MKYTMPTQDKIFWLGICLGAACVLSLVVYVFLSEPTCPPSSRAMFTRYSGWQCVVTVEPMRK